MSISVVMSGGMSLDLLVWGLSCLLPYEFCLFFSSNKYLDESYHWMKVSLHNVRTLKRWFVQRK